MLVVGKVVLITAIFNVFNQNSLRHHFLLLEVLAVRKLVSDVFFVIGTLRGLRKLLR